MNYLKSSYTAISMMIILLAFPSCDKYLDVQPEDLFLEKSVYNNQSSIRNVLNGIYLDMASKESYGESNTCTVLDVLAQYYDCSVSGHPMNTLQRYEYEESGSMSELSAMWNKNYNSILNINLFIQNVSPGEDILPGEEKNWMLGEAYGLRAFLGFDLLRLFGPMYQPDSLSAAIPYPLTPESKINPVLPAKEVMELIIHDLEQAAMLLENDPTRSEGVISNSSITDQYFSNRNRRMNYFAVQALMARVFLYRGDVTAAKSKALEVVQSASKFFPWSPASESNPGNSNPDRVFSSEVLFGLENIKLKETQSNWFSASLNSASILTPYPANLESIFDKFDNDYRYRVWFTVDRTTTRTNKTFFKYADIKDNNLPFRNLLPLIRMSEMYLILSECEPDITLAAQYLNTLRKNRGLPDADFTGKKMDLIIKAYQQEFWGEGQLFYLYKRLHQSKIPNGSGGTGNIDMSSDQYVVPIPQSETLFR